MHQSEGNREEGKECLCAPGLGLNLPSSSHTPCTRPCAFLALPAPQAYPLDLVRTRLSAQTQVDGTSHYRGILHATRSIVAEDGWRGLYRGLGATLAQVGGNICWIIALGRRRMGGARAQREARLGWWGEGLRFALGGWALPVLLHAAHCPLPPLPQVTPSLAFHFMFYATFKDSFTALSTRGAGASASNASTSAGRSSDGGGGSSTSSGSGSGSRAPSSRGGSGNIGGSGGGSLVAGLPADEPGARRVLGSSPSSSGRPPPQPAASFQQTAALNTAAAGLAGLMSSTLTFPLDKIRRIMQVQRRGAAGVGAFGVGSSSGWWATAADILRRGGPAAFYEGISTEYIKVVPGMIIAFLTFEALKEALGAGQSKRDRHSQLEQQQQQQRWQDLQRQWAPHDAAVEAAARAAASAEMLEGS
jgi:hypothetical protein